MTTRVPHIPLHSFSLLPVLFTLACSSFDGAEPAEPVQRTEVAPEPVAIDDEVDTDLPVGFELSAELVEPPAVLDDDSEETLAPTARYTLRRGETLAHFARWSGLPVEVIAETSGLDLFDTFDVGTEIRVPVDATARAELEVERDRHHIRRAEGYLAARGGAMGTEFYTVQTGDSAWSIARNQRGIPLWLLETYNPSADLDRLRPGEELMVPIIADIVVDAAEPESDETGSLDHSD